MADESRIAQKAKELPLTRFWRMRYLALFSILQEVNTVFSECAHEGCRERTWAGYENGNGEEIGREMDELLLKIKEAIK